jgi:RNA polymerase sigma-70 factor (ECF subfamily)
VAALRASERAPPADRPQETGRCRVGCSDGVPGGRSFSTHGVVHIGQAHDIPWGAGGDAAAVGARVAGAYQLVQADLVRYLRAVVGRQVAEDVASQVWVEVVAGAPAFRGDDAAFRRWVFATARRRGLDHRRRWWQRSVVLRPPGAHELDRPAHDPPRGDEAWAIARIRRLPAAQAEIVLLRVLGGFSAEEVAEITGRSPGSVRVIQHRALRLLARDLAADPAASPDV